MQNKQRENCRSVQVGPYTLGGNNTVYIQSMTNTKTSDVEATIKQIEELKAAGCQIVRLAMLDEDDPKAIPSIKKAVQIPLVADIHFDYRLAIAAIDNGIDKIRLNPGNIEKREQVEAVVNKCKEKHIPIRIGINSGSVPRDIVDRDGGVKVSGLIEAAKRHISILEELDFHDIVLSFKCSDVELTMQAYREAAKVFDYPLHLGVTEAGTFFTSSIKSSIAIGALLEDGIGSTLRVSVSGDPVEEIKICKAILNSLHMLPNAANFISCPTCGRTRWDLIPFAKKMEAYLETIPYPITVAIMGCAVNGPGEARHADLGIAGGIHEGLIFKHGQILRKVKEEDFETELKKEIDILIKEKFQK